MKLVTELIEYALHHNWLTDEDKRVLEAEGFYAFDWSDQDRRHDPLPIDEEDLLEVGSAPRSHSPNRRRGKGKSNPAKPKLTVEELNQRVQEDWKKLTEQFPRYQELWDSWKAGRLTQVFDDGFTLNDVYSLMSVELRDFHDFSGPEPAAFRQLLKQVGNTIGKYSWVVKCPEMASMIEFLPFRQQLFEEVRKLYETDPERFASLSSQNGRLKFRGWEKAAQPDTTSMKVWTILDLTSEPVTPEKIEEILTWQTPMAFAMQINFDYVSELLTKLEKRDWSPLTVITKHEIPNTILNSVVIPKGVTVVESCAFYRCRSLTFVEIPEGVTKIQYDAFSGCRSLTAVRIPKGVTYIGKSAFFDCRSLTSVVIPEGVTGIGNYAFLDCSSLTSVTIPDSVKEIGINVFTGCTALKDWGISSAHPYFKTDGVGLLTKDGKKLVTCLVSAEGYRIAEGVTKIESWACYQCSSLTFVVIPEGVTEIGENAFENCSSLTSIVIPKGVTKIGRCAFCGCSSLTSAAIPEGVTKIENYTFCNCSSLTFVVIPEGVTEIGEHAFRGCSSLTFVVIPESVKRIRWNAFMDCPNLTIQAPVGSYAEEYAKGAWIPFKHR